MPVVNQSPPDIESDLIDLGEVPLAELPSYDEPSLAPVIRRLLRRIDDPTSITTGYNPQRAD
jgi:FXSXX-COOH protein